MRSAGFLSPDMTFSPIPIIVRWISRRALRWCYREVRYVGRERVPASGATLLFGNHPNDLPDALVGYFTTDRSLRYIATISSVTLPFAEVVYRGLSVIPVARVRDARKMRLRGIEMGTVNESAFVAVQEAFHAGDIVGVFPEGGVNDSFHVGKPRPGVAKMALESLNSAAESALSLVAFGIHYEAPQTLRSDVIVVIGTPFVLRDWVSQQTDPSASRLTDRLRAELVAVSRSSSSWENAGVRDRLVAASTAVAAAANEPLLATAARLQGQCGLLVEARDTGHFSSTDSTVHWRTIADDLCNHVEVVGGIPTSARDTARVLDAAGVLNPQANWPSIVWVLAVAIPAALGLALNGPLQWGVWRYARHTATMRTEMVSRAIVPGLHLIFLGYVIQGGLIALGLRAASVSSWWALPVVMLLPRLGDLGLAWRDAVCVLRLRSRVRRLSVADRTAIHAAADRVRSAWMTLSSLPSSQS